MIEEQYPFFMPVEKRVSLTPRQKDVLRALSVGLQNKEIAYTEPVRFNGEKASDRHIYAAERQNADRRRRQSPDAEPDLNKRPARQKRGAFLRGRDRGRFTASGPWPTGRAGRRRSGFCVVCIPRFSPRPSFAVCAEERRSRNIRIP